MKRVLILTAIILDVTICVLRSSLMAQESGHCYFKANEDIYLKIYNLDKDGVERWKVWEGHLPEGGTKSFSAPYGQVGYATKKNPDDPWEENQEECYGGAEIDIP